MYDHTCDVCGKALKTKEDKDAGACLKCDEFRCNKCGEEYDVEYGICGCNEFRDHANADVVADVRQGK